VQADWEQSDAQADDYIKNKPTAMPADGGNADTVDGKHASDFDTVDAENAGAIADVGTELTQEAARALGAEEAISALIQAIEEKQVAQYDETNGVTYVELKDLDAALHGLATDTYVDKKIADALMSVLHYVGDVATYDDLPTTGNSLWDLYHVADTGNGYYWFGDEWNLLDFNVDLSAYYTAAETDSLLALKADSSVTDAISTIIGTLSGLSTTAKTTLVAAINEIVTNISAIDISTVSGGTINANIKDKLFDISFGTPKYIGSISNYLFYPGGLSISQGEGESSGIYFDGDKIVMWSPVDGDALVYYDEDTTSTAVFKVDSSGNFYNQAGNKMYSASNLPPVLSTTGTSTTQAMSQKAVTDAINDAIATAITNAIGGSY
jgi:hypothetical protein